MLDLLRPTLLTPMFAQETVATLVTAVAPAAKVDATVDSTNCSGSVSHDPPITFLTRASELFHVADPTGIPNANQSMLRYRV